MDGTSEELDTASRDQAELRKDRIAIVTETDPLRLPARFVRSGRRTCTWGLPRRFAGYEPVGHEQLSVRGAAPKFILRNLLDINDWYIVKSAEKWGEIETLSELLNNVIGRQLGFPMAHAGVIRADGTLHFVSRNFQNPNETLIHGSLLLQKTFGDDLNGVGKKKWDEQRTYDLELIADMLRNECGECGDELFGALLQMLVFDALLGSMDRHLQNWGVLASVSEPRAYRLAPIFDSARALLWDKDEDKLRMLETNKDALHAYVNRSKPIMGCASTGRAVNHFELVEHLHKRYPMPIHKGLQRVHPTRVSKVLDVLQDFPFRSGLSFKRRVLIAKVLMMRAERLHQIIQ